LDATKKEKGIQAKEAKQAWMETIATAFATKHANIALRENCHNNGTINVK